MNKEEVDRLQHIRDAEETLKRLDEIKPDPSVRYGKYTWKDIKEYRKQCINELITFYETGKKSQIETKK